MGKLRVVMVEELPSCEGQLYGNPIPDGCKIPSEFIEPYLQRFLMMCLEEVAYFNTKPAEIKARLDGVRYFVSCYGGIHSELAVSNMYGKFMSIPDDKLKSFAKQIFEGGQA